MTQCLHGKTAFVTGAGGGIGRAAALLFAEQGARVAGVDIDADAARATLEAVEKAGGQAAVWQADFTHHHDVRSTFEDVLSRFGRIDVAFNVAGGSGRRHGDGPVHECSEAGWNWTLDTNLKSVFLCCKYLATHMLAQGGGAIVNLASVLGLVGGDEDFATHAYAASKGAIISLSRAMASYYAPHGIRVNVVCPSLIATGMSRRAQADARIRKRLKTLQPLTADFGKPDDVAHAALYLLSDQAAFVTGAVLTVDGGWTVR